MDIGFKRMKNGFLLLKPSDKYSKISIRYS